MKNLPFTIIFFALSFSLFSQKNYFAIGAFGTIDKYNYHFREHSNFIIDTDTDLASMTGLKFQYCFKNKIAAVFGIAYSQKSYSGFVKWNSIVGSTDSSIIYTESHLILKYLTIPISIKYYMLDKQKFKLSSIVQFNSEFLKDRRETLIDVDNPERRFKFLHQYVKKIHFSAQVNLGFEYHPSQKVFFTLEPNYRFGLKTIDGGLMDRKPTSFGGELSVNFII